MYKDTVTRFGEWASRLEATLRAAPENISTNPDKTIQNVCDQSKTLLELGRKVEEADPESYSILVRAKERELLGWAADFIFSHFREILIRARRESETGSKEIIGSAERLVDYVASYVLPYYQRIERGDLFLQTLLYIVYEVASECPGFKEAKGSEEKDTALRLYTLLNYAKTIGIRVPEKLLQKFTPDQAVVTSPLGDNPITSTYASMLDQLEQNHKDLATDREYIRLRRRLLAVATEHWKALQKHFITVQDTKCRCGGEPRAEAQRVVEEDGCFYNIVTSKCAQCGMKKEDRFDLDEMIAEKIALTSLEQFLEKNYSITLPQFEGSKSESQDW